MHFVDGRVHSATLPNRTGNSVDPSIITLENFEASLQLEEEEEEGGGKEGRAYLRKSTRRLKERIDQQ